MSNFKFAIAAFVWLVLLAVGVLLWKFMIAPSREAAKQQEIKQRENEILQNTQGTSKYKVEIALGIDSFTGYAVFRSPEFQEDLAKSGMRVNLMDDGADYAKRLKALETGELQMAVFPADALIKTSAQLGRMPATIVAIVDESRGADAMIAYKSKVADAKNLDLINTPETRFVLVGDSPSETLTRVVMHDFDLRKLSSDPFIRVESPEKVIERYKRASPSSPEIFVTWEPYVSQLLENAQMHDLFNSSKLTGYVVDTLVVSRDYLLKNQDQVEQVLESYFRSLYTYREASKLKQWIIEDAKKSGQPFQSDQADRLAERIAAGIQWRNTQENFVHFGLRGGELVHVEDMLRKITSILVSSNMIRNDPTGGKPSSLFFDRPMASLFNRNFHPGLQSEQVREDTDLATLTEKQWESLVPVGTLNVTELTFARGNAALTEVSRTILDDLSVKLRSWPRYYLMIRGNASNTGNVEANEALAAQRAAATLEYLQSQGIPAQRMRATRGKITGATNVTFQVGELPY